MANSLPLQDGDPGGHMRRALDHLSFRKMADVEIGPVTKVDHRPVGTAPSALSPPVSAASMKKPRAAACRNIADGCWPPD